MIKLSNCCHTTCRTESEGAQPIPFFLFLGLPIPGSLFMRRPTRCRPSRQVSSNRKLAKPAIQLPWLPSRGTRRGTFWWRGVAVGLFVFRCPPPVGAVTQPRAGHISSSRCDPCDPCKSSAFGEEVPFGAVPDATFWCQRQDVAPATPKHAEKLLPPSFNNANLTRRLQGT
jgi:hypothetical protein